MESDQPSQEAEPRRGFLGRVSSLVMFGGLAAGYGTLAAYAGRFLFPNRRQEPNWQFVAGLEELVMGSALNFKTPAGARIVVTRQKVGESADCFVALSSVCPHLGCAVHWEPNNDRFFCPCHNGAFDASGVATEGPPATANQSLTKYPLKVEKGMLFIAVAGDGI